MYLLRIVHNANSSSAQIEWHVDVPTPNCKLRLENESPFARQLVFRLRLVIQVMLVIFQALVLNDYIML